MKMPNRKVRKWLVLIVALLAGIYFNVHTQSFLAFIVLTAIFVFFAFLPLVVIEKVLAEERRSSKILCAVICVPVVLLISGLVLFSHINDEPLSYDAGSVGPYPVWYVNPITHACSYRLQKLVTSRAGSYHYWYSAGECLQSDKDRIFKDEYATFSAINLSPHSPRSIAVQCLVNLTDYLPHSYLHKEDVPDHLGPYEGRPLDVNCYDVKLETRWCKNRAARSRTEEEKSVQTEKASLKRDFIKNAGHETGVWGVSLQTFTSLCPNHTVFDYFMSADISLDNSRQEDEPIIDDDSWSPSPRSLSLSKMMEAAQRSASDCRRLGGIIQGGGVGDSEDHCIFNDSNKLPYSLWDGSLKCGDMSTDTMYTVYNGNNNQWDFTMNCKNMTQCNGPENALCNKEGCAFSQQCLDAI